MFALKVTEKDQTFAGYVAKGDNGSIILTFTRADAAQFPTIAVAEMMAARMAENMGAIVGYRPNAGDVTPVSVALGGEVNARRYGFDNRKHGQ